MLVRGAEKRALVEAIGVEKGVFGRAASQGGPNPTHRLLRPPGVYAVAPLNGVVPSTFDPFDPAPLALPAPLSWGAVPLPGVEAGVETPVIVLRGPIRPNQRHNPNNPNKQVSTTINNFGQTVTITES